MNESVPSEGHWQWQLRINVRNRRHSFIDSSVRTTRPRPSYDEQVGWSSVCINKYGLFAFFCYLFYVLRFVLIKFSNNYLSLIALMFFH